MKKIIEILVSMVMVSLIVMMGLTASAAGSYEKVWDFEKCKEGAALVDGDLHLAFSTKNYYFKKEYGNMVLDIAKKQSGCCMNDEMKAQLEAKNLNAASYQFRFKITEDDYDDATVIDKNTNSLNFWFRQHDNANAYFLGIYPHHIDIYDQDATNPAYKDGALEHANQRESKVSYQWVREKNRWYQINIVTKPTTDFVTVGDRKESTCYNAVYLDGKLILEWTAKNCWINPFGFEVFGWNMGAKLDDLKVSTDPNKYIPSGAVTLKQDSDYAGASGQQPAGSNGNGNTATASNKSTGNVSSNKITASSKNQGTGSIVNSADGQVGDSSISQSDADSNDNSLNESSDIDTDDSLSKETTSGKVSKVEDFEANNSRGNIALILGIVGMVLLIASGVVVYIFVIRPAQKGKKKI